MPLVQQKEKSPTVLVVAIHCQIYFQIRLVIAHRRLNQSAAPGIGALSPPIIFEVFSCALRLQAALSSLA